MPAEPEMIQRERPQSQDYPSAVFNNITSHLQPGFTSDPWKGNGTGVYNGKRIWIRAVPGEHAGTRAIQLRYEDRVWKIEFVGNWRDHTKAKLHVHHQSGRGAVLQVQQPITSVQMLRKIINATAGKVKKVQASIPTMTPLQQAVSDLGVRIYHPGSGRV